VRPPVSRTPNPARRRWRGDALAFGFVGLLLWAVTFLPPDTTLAEVQAAGILRACVPDAFPPLVTGDRARPGLDIEILERVAAELGVRLVPNVNSAMGRDFNPRNWRVTRAQCLVLAGGIVDTTTTRGFLVVAPTRLETGWAAVAADPPPATLEGVAVGFFAGLSGLDRLALSRWLRDRGAVVTVVSSAADARQGLADGRFRVVVSEALTARRIAAEADASAYWLAGTGSRVPLAFGLWKGDLTLERAVKRELDRLQRSGELDELFERYELGPIEEGCPFCL
jgi:ABC-type amino acid transport substrate-binding protein